MKFRMILLGPDDPEGRPSRGVEARGHRRKTISYEQHEGGMVRLEGAGNGPVRCTPLTNFHARIVREIISDDGAEQRRTMRLEAEVAGKTVSFVLQTSDFNRMNWVLRELGPKAIVYPDQQQHTRAAIQSLSNEIQQERVFAHLGWAKEDQGWVYLQPGQVIGAIVPDLKVCLADPLQHYCAPPPTDPEALATAIRSSLKLLTVAQDRVTIPLLAAVFPRPRAFPAADIAAIASCSGSQVGDAMRNLERRLRKLERFLTDSSGLIPHSPAWMEYWMKELEDAIERRESGQKKPIPLEAIRAWMRAHRIRNNQY